MRELGVPTQIVLAVAPQSLPNACLVQRPDHLVTVVLRQSMVKIGFITAMHADLMASIGQLPHQSLNTNIHDAVTAIAGWLDERLK